MQKSAGNIKGTHAELLQARGLARNRQNLRGMTASDERRNILGILKETDYVEITPYAYRYMQGDNVGSQMSLPYPGEDISRETIKKIIASTKWEKIEEASCKPEPL